MDRTIFTVQWAFNNNNDHKAIWRDIPEIEEQGFENLGDLAKYMLRYSIELMHPTTYETPNFDTIKLRVIERYIEDTVL